jgi:hypothetical protein
MSRTTHRCPSCNREFRNVTDYPKVLLLSVKRLAIPEAVDFFSDRAAEKAMKRIREELLETGHLKQGGINMTPEIARARQHPEVTAYLDSLDKMIGQEVEPHKLLPPFKPHGVFKWAHPVPSTEIFLSLGDDERPTEDQGTAAVQLHSPGPSLGSAGGPTLQPLGAIALLAYRGLLFTNSHNGAPDKPPPKT